MTPEEVTALITSEIGKAGGRWDITNAHGVELRRCLVKPRKEAYLDPTTNKTIELWTVLEENPDGPRGYMIVFDEESKAFGLSLGDDQGRLVFLGIYGTFLENLDGM